MHGHALPGTLEVAGEHVLDGLVAAATMLGRVRRSCPIITQESASTSLYWKWSCLSTLMRRPLGTTTLPDVCSISPARILSSVDLPAPLGPISP